MNTNLTMTNESFSFLHGSDEFLNIILNNISCCVLLLDKDVKLRAFNNASKTIFSSKKDEDLLYMRCGEAIGCAYQIKEQKDCGNTSRCGSCELRIAALTSYVTDEVIYKNQVTKPFFNYKKQQEDKRLQFSTRIFRFNNEKYVILIIEDITNFVERENNYLH